MRQLFLLTPWEEHRFWLEILQDHAYFVYESLSPGDEEKVRTAASFIREFERALGGLNRLSPQLPSSDPQMIGFAQTVHPLAQSYYQFEGHLQALRIQNRVVLNLSPTYLNGTLSENAEYLRLLDAFAAGQNPGPLNMADLVDLWLEDQLGHATLLLNYIDVAEVVWTEKIRHFQTAFSALMIKQRQLRKYLRFTPEGFPAQRQFAVEITTAVNGFAQVVQQVTALFLNERVLNRFTLRFIEHHFPETCYFLRKLTLYAPEIQVKPCSLTKPSFGSANREQ